MLKTIYLVMAGIIITAANAFAGIEELPFKVPHYTGRILPNPQNVQYKKGFIKLDNAVILPGKGISKNDLRIKIIKQRIKTLGGNAAVIKSASEAKAGQTIICLGSSLFADKIIRDKQVPSKVQGYALTITSKPQAAVVLKGYDKLGLTWALSSFIQLTDSRNNKATARTATVKDWPRTLRRGAWFGEIQKDYRDSVYFCFITKMNFPIFTRIWQIDKTMPGRWNRNYGGGGNKQFWRYPPTATIKKRLKLMGDFFNPLGIDWYAGVCPIRGDGKEKINCASQEDFDYYYAHVKAIGEAGGNLMIVFDDSRFPRNPDEKKVFKSCSQADAYFVNKVYKKFKKDFSHLKVSFDVVCYWGPEYPPAYPEERDKYLAGISILPKDISMVWNGPTVRATNITPSSIKWVKNSYKRKPLLVMFNGGKRTYSYHFPLDPVDGWPKWFKEPVYDNMHAATLGANIPMFGSILFSFLDYFWNPKAYNPEKDIKEIVTKLVGKDSYKIAKSFNKEIAWFDQWSFKASPNAARNIVAIKKRLKKLKEYSDDVECNRWIGLNSYFGTANSFVKSLDRADLKQFTQQAEIVQADAKKEVGFIAGKDIFLSPYDFAGGGAPELYAFRCPKRLCTWVMGKKTSISKMHAGFMLKDSALTKDKVLIISGQDDDSVKKCPIEIKINGNVVFKGLAPLKRLGWYRHSFPVKVSFLKEGGNILTIQCMSDSSLINGPPFFMVNYVVIKDKK